MTTERKPFAVYAITMHGLEIAAKLREKLGAADVYVSEKLIERARSIPQLEEAIPMALPMGPALTRTFTAYDCHVFIVSIGAVVRMIAPLLKDKKTDPAVLCVDDAARFAICVLSGHVGRGNSFTNHVADMLDAQPVITTASDAIGTLTVDILGRELGWVLDDLNRNVTRGCAAVVNAAPVLFVQEAGEPDWWPLDKPLPPGVEYAASLQETDPARYEILLIATDREIRKTHPAHWENSIIYRPRSIALGIGCDRNTAPEMMERGVLSLLEGHNISVKSVRMIGTIDKKRGEPAIVALAERFKWSIRFYTAVELDAVGTIENPSETVKGYVGTRGVAEPAALLAAGAERLLISKQIYTEPGAGRSMTLAAARMPFPARNMEARRD